MGEGKSVGESSSDGDEERLGGMDLMSGGRTGDRAGAEDRRRPKQVKLNGWTRMVEGEDQVLLVRVTGMGRWEEKKEEQAGGCQICRWAKIIHRSTLSSRWARGHVWAPCPAHQQRVVFISHQQRAVEKAIYDHSAHSSSPQWTRNMHRTKGSSDAIVEIVSRAQSTTWVLLLWSSKHPNKAVNQMTPSSNESYKVELADIDKYLQKMI